MTYPSEPESKVTHRLKERAERESVKFLLIGNTFAVQAIVELERKGFCERSCWSKELPISEAGSVMATHAGSVMRIFKRWYPMGD